MTTTATDIWGELRPLIEHAITNDPRSLQTALGPSSLGTACDRCLVHLLAGHRVTDHVVPWLPTIGRAVHKFLEDVFHERIFLHDETRWWPEERLLVGQVAGQDIHGSCDLYDEQTATVVDFKCTGKTTLDKVRRGGASLTYQAQIMLYGKGWEDRGKPVEHVAILFLPRNAVSLQHAQVWRAPYSRRAAELALERANALHAGITTLGVDAVLAMTPPHTGEEFSCDRWPGEAAPDLDHQLAGLIPQTPGTTVTGSTAPQGQKTQMEKTS